VLVSAAGRLPPTSPRRSKSEHRPECRQPADAPRPLAAAGRVRAAVLPSALSGRCGGHRMSRRYHDGSGSACPRTLRVRVYQFNYGTGALSRTRRRRTRRLITRPVLAAVAPRAGGLVAAPRRPRTSAPRSTMLLRHFFWILPHNPPTFSRLPPPQYQPRRPENRLVTRQLKRNGRARLVRAGRLEADYQRFTAESQSPRPLRAGAAIRAGRRPPAGLARTDDHQADAGLLRISSRTSLVNVAGDSELVDVTITWAGGHQNAQGRPSARRQAGPASLYLPRCSPSHRLALRPDSTQIAGILNSEGSARLSAPAVHRPSVRTLISHRGIRARQRDVPAVLTALAPAEWSASGPVADLAMPPQRLQLDLPRLDHRPQPACKPGTGSSPRRRHYASYASAGLARPATKTRAPLARARPQDQRGGTNLETPKKLTHYHGGPPSTVHLRPAARPAGLGRCWPGPVAVVKGQLSGLMTAMSQGVTVIGEKPSCRSRPRVNQRSPFDLSRGADYQRRALPQQLPHRVFAVMMVPSPGDAEALRHFAARSPVPAAHMLPQLCSCPYTFVAADEVLHEPVRNGVVDDPDGQLAPSS